MSVTGDRESALPSTRRRRFALGVATPAVIVIAIVLITTGGSSPRRSPPSAAALPHRRAAGPALPALDQKVANPAIGVSGEIPSDWTAVHGQGFVRMAIHDGASEIVVAGLTNHSGTHELMLSALRSIAKSYSGINLKLGAETKLGGLAANSRVVYAHNQYGVPVRILVAGAAGRQIGYVLEAFTAEKASAHDLTETQEIVQSLQLTG